MFTRREWVSRSLALASMMGLIGRGRTVDAQENKAGRVNKETAKYQGHPNNMQMCGMCKFYIPAGGQAGSGMMMDGQMMGPDHMGGMMGRDHVGRGMDNMMAAGTCQVVEGSINPMGWCVLYQPVSR